MQCTACPNLCQCPSPSIGHSTPFLLFTRSPPIKDTLCHPYMAMIAAGGTTLPMIQRGLEPVECEHMPVGGPPPVPVPVGVDTPSLATRFLFLLHEELRPSLYVLPRDSEGFLIDPLWTIAVTLRSTDPMASLLFPITQESVIQTHQSLDPNNLEFETGDLRYPAPLASSIDQEEKPNIRYLYTITRED